jgi:hypothetical protein
MNIQFYIHEKEVDRPVFKHCSSHCEIWIQLLNQHRKELDETKGTLKLFYDAAKNIVVPSYDVQNLFVKRIHETAIELSLQCFVYVQPSWKVLNKAPQA